MKKWYLIFTLAFLSCQQPEEPAWPCLELSVSAYNSLAYQTMGDPTLTAFGDTLKPGMKVIAVSRDLLDSGLTHNSKVYIPQLEDTFLVKDKMNRRFIRKIDIYFGVDRDSAIEWGLQKTEVCFEKNKKSE